MKETLLTPVGRLVMGSLTKPSTKNMSGAPLVDKNGQPRQEFWLNLAIEKKGESHWNETTWGQIIYSVGSKSFPGGQYKGPNFAWKLIDGDSTVPNSEGNKPCDHEGYPGHWVLRFRSGFAPIIVNEDGTPFKGPDGAINSGDYIQIYGSVSDNGSTVQPGIYLNFTHVAFIAYGARINTTIDPKNIGFGGVLPAGASKTPVSKGFTPPVESPPMQPAPPPHTAILQPKLMLAPAGGLSYDAYISAGWTDAQLIQHGYMQA